MNLMLSQVELPIRLRLDHPMGELELGRFCAENEPLRVERDANGELIVMSPTFSEGGSTEAEVTLELGLWARADGRGKVFGPKAGFTLTDTSVRAADAAWVSYRCWDALTVAQRRSFAPICPEFVVKIRSSSDRLGDLQEKMKMWVANGAELTWLIDPQRRVVEVHRPGAEPKVYEAPSSMQGSGPVLGFELVMSRVWG